jgi:hypothetical protein
MSNKITLWIGEEAKSIFESGQSAEEFLIYHFKSVEAAVEKGYRIAVNDVEQFFGEVEPQEEPEEPVFNQQPSVPEGVVVPEPVGVPGQIEEPANVETDNQQAQVSPKV